MTADLDDLTELQRRFIEAYLIEPSASRAYIKAGGTATTPDAIYAGAYQILRSSRVKAVLKELRDERSKRTRVKMDWVVRQIVKVYRRCMTAVPVLDAEGNPTGKYKFDAAGANKALDMLMKHTGGYEKDNDQRTGRTPDQVKQELREMGIPIDLILKPPPREISTERAE